jgi:anti-anti-sigma regulatory factor
MNTQNIYLPAICDQKYAEELHFQLLSDYEQSHNVTIDAAQVQKISTSVFQVLLSAFQTFKKKNKDVEIKNASNEFNEKCEILAINSLNIKKGEKSE